MPSLFYAGQPDYIEKLNTLATAASMTNGTVAASFLSLAVTGTATAASFVGPLTGNASTATTLATARNINGVSFNGSADITVTAAAGTLTGATLAAGVTASSLTSVGTLTALTVSGQSVFSGANAGLELGAKASANTPFIDFNSSGNSNDYDARIIASAGTTAGTGNLTVFLNSFNISGALGVTGQSTFAAGTAAAPSVKVGAGNDGMFSIASGNLGLAASGRLALRLDTVASSVNYLYGYANATGGAPVLRSVGSDTNVDLTLGTQGSGAFDFLSHGALTRQFRIASVASATNYWQAQGNVTSGAPTLFATGSDTNVNALYSTKGTGEHFFYSGGAANLQFKVGHVANAVNSITAYGGITGNAPAFVAEGTDTNIGLGLYGKGSGPVFTAVRGALSAYFDNPASAVNYWSISGSAAGGFSNILEALGTDANIQNLYASKGTYGHMFRTNGSGGQTQFLIAHAPSAVNYYQVQGAATAGAPVFFATGSDTNVSAIYSLKGTGNHVFYTATTTAAQFVVAHTAAAVNYPQVTGAASGNFPSLLFTGADANVNAAYSTKGTGSHFFYSNNNTAPIFSMASGGASAVNYLQAQSSITGVNPSLISQGSDSNISMAISSKGSGNIGLYTGSGAVGAFFVTHTASGVNWIQATGSATGNAPAFSVGGADTNIDFALTPKGTGVLRFGTHSALAAETVTGYITIKDSAGNTRKLAVLS